LHGLEPLAGDFQHVAIGAHGGNLFGIGLQHQSRQHIAIVGVVGQQVVDVFFQVGGVGRGSDELFRPPVMLPALVGHDALAQGLVRGVLLAGIDGGVDIQTSGVGSLPYWA